MHCKHYQSKFSEYTQKFRINGVYTKKSVIACFVRNMTNNYCIEKF